VARSDYAFSHKDELLPHRDIHDFHKNDAEQPMNWDLFHDLRVGRIFASRSPDAPSLTEIELS
jgi:hypothetical protein